MVPRRAPIARRMPISRVRSFTETKRMFMIPMPATMAVMMPTRMPVTLVAIIIWLNPSSSLSCRLTEKFSSWSGARCRALRITAVTSSSVSRTLPSGATTATTRQRLLPKVWMKADGRL